MGTAISAAATQAAYVTYIHTLIWAYIPHAEYWYENGTTTRLNVAYPKDGGNTQN